jgi:hypothetical protein
MTQANAGYFRSGLPYNRFGRGPRPLVIFQGLMFENKSQSPLVTQMYHQFAADHPDLVRRLVIHSAACRLNPAAEAMQMAVGRLAAEGRWREAGGAALRRHRGGRNMPNTIARNRSGRESQLEFRIAVL